MLIMLVPQFVWKASIHHNVYIHHKLWQLSLPGMLKICVSQKARAVKCKRPTVLKWCFMLYTLLLSQLLYMSISKQNTLGLFNPKMTRQQNKYLLQGVLSGYWSVFESSHCFLICYMSDKCSFYYSSSIIYL